MKNFRRYAGFSKILHWPQCKRSNFSKPRNEQAVTPCTHWPPSLIGCVFSFEMHYRTSILHRAIFNHQLTKISGGVRCGANMQESSKLSFSSTRWQSKACVHHVCIDGLLAHTIKKGACVKFMQLIPWWNKSDYTYRVRGDRCGTHTDRCGTHTDRCSNPPVVLHIK